MIAPVLRARKKDNLVHYLLSGLPFYSHAADNLTKFHYVTSRLQVLCKNWEISNCFHLSGDWNKKLSDEGESAFFNAGKPPRQQS
jgi:hypothetical protein